MRPEDIMTNIQQTVPVSGSAESGVGALVAPTTSTDVGVEPTPQTLTPEQIFASQQEYNEVPKDNLLLQKLHLKCLIKKEWQVRECFKNLYNQ